MGLHVRVKHCKSKMVVEEEAQVVTHWKLVTHAFLHSPVLLF